MHRRAFLFAAAAAPFGAQIAFAEDTATIPLDLRRGQPRVRLFINGADQGEAIFDTGASGSAIHRPLAEQLSLPNEGVAGVRSGAGGETIEGFMTTVINAAMNGVAVPDFRAIAIPMLRPDTVAVLSANIFTGNLLLLDFQNARMQPLTKSSATIPTTEATPYDDGPRPLPSIWVTLPTGQRLLAHLDTGSPASLALPREMADTLPLSTPLVEAGRARLINGERTLYRATLNGAAQVGPLNITNPEITFMEGLPHGNVGMELLRQLTITLDPAERRLWVTPHA
ncbi:pepsin/retropepsin-like aspartic protease family protein [Terricaulis silvestris]|uniref:Putative aspartyl protease n=1 Tax=Terricaulis silvestris TaxID=2686094 RepID=A0A6I6MFN5_9CAUL|nr:pepsin/retropepsin-like aspartic protease family protein [Terricaulis silvestris]QGZ93280.1 putative aspartyl protease [Terricaulis silvestris]